MRRKIYRKTLLQVFTYTEMLRVGGTGDEVYFAYGIFGQYTCFILVFVIRHELKNLSLNHVVPYLILT